MVLDLAITGAIVGVGLFVVSIIFTYKWIFLWRRRYKGQFINQGVYRYVRYPHYLPIIMVVFSFFLIHPELINLILVLLSFIFIHLSIKKEESQMIERYGDEYKEYIKKVPWRLIPRVY